MLVPKKVLAGGTKKRSLTDSARHFIYEMHMAFPVAPLFGHFLHQLHNTLHRNSIAKCWRLSSYVRLNPLGLGQPSLGFDYGRVLRSWAAPLPSLDGRRHTENSIQDYLHGVHNRSLAAIRRQR